MLAKRRAVFFLFIVQISFSRVLSKEFRVEKTETWACDSGEIIDIDNFCDGTSHCLDGSDETAKHCNQIKCPSFSFRCQYGACISKKGICNGKKDCEDGSDETDPSCRPKIIPPTECPDASMMKCNSGECIADVEICDGVPNCKDASDETFDLCAKYSCPAFAFKCKYGACIAGPLKCNGIRDCIDGSDEDPYICDVYSNHTLEAAEVKPSKIYRTCVLPSDGDLMVAENFITKEMYPLGSNINGDRTVVNFYCKDQKQLKGLAVSTCVDGEWTVPLPKCAETVFCRSTDILTTISRESYCTYNNKPVDCNQPLESGSVVHLSCAQGYSPRKNKAKRNIFCYENGVWDENMLQCKANCGMALNGTPEDMLPWVVSVFKDEGNENYVYKCRGYIIAERLVVTDPGCISSNRFTENDEPELYHVIEGNYQETYNNANFLGLNVHNVSEIIISKHKKSPTVSQVIGVISITNYFKFSARVAPICLPSKKVTDKIQTVESESRFQTTPPPETEVQIITLDQVIHPNDTTMDFDVRMFVPQLKKILRTHRV